jgi:DNA-binding transcriptional ArsR family regulator
VATQPITNIGDPRYVRALAHPMRIRLLAMLEESDASPVQLAQRLGQPLGSVAYHVRILNELGLLDLVSTRQRRGAMEHFYRARAHPRIDDETWSALGPVTKQRMLSAMLQQLTAYLERSAAAGGFDRADSHITRTAMKLDERGWSELADATKRWLEEVARVEGEARERLAGGADALDVGLVILLFEALPFSAPDPA